MRGCGSLMGSLNMSRDTAVTEERAACFLKSNVHDEKKQAEVPPRGKSACEVTRGTGHGDRRMGSIHLRGIYSRKKRI